MAAAAGDLERWVMAAVKASAARGDPPLLQAAEAARCAREASAGATSCGGGGLAAALVANLCFAHNTGAMWKLLDQAMSSRLISPLLTLALLTPRVLPNRRAQPEAYRLYLELLGRYAVVPVYSERPEFKAMITKSIDDEMQLSHSYGLRPMDFGQTVILFVLSVIKLLIDCIFEDCGLRSNSDEHNTMCAIGVNMHMDVDCVGNSIDRKDKHREYLRQKNTHMALEVVEKITANKYAQVFLRLAYLNMPEKFNSLLQRIQLIGALKSKNALSAHYLLDNLSANIQKVIATRYQLDRSRLLGVLVSTQSCSSAACNIFGAGRGSCWIPFDMFMENAMDERHLHAISSIETLTELSKTLQVLNRATWQETFQALWISALRLVQQDPVTLEGPFPHLDSRLCMLLAIVPLSIVPILKEESDKLNEGMISVRREDLLSSLQVLGQYFGLLLPPLAVVDSANSAATKAAIAVFNFKSRSDDIHSSSKDSASMKAVGNMLHLIVEACISRKLIDTSVYFWPGYIVPVKDSPAQESPWSAFMEGSALMGLKDLLMVTPASRLVELEKLHTFAISGSEEEKLAACKILCGASLLRGWNIQEHVVRMVLKLLLTLVPLDSGSDDCMVYIHHMPMLHALMSGISSIDIVHILSMYGLVPEVAAILMPVCEIFGSLPLSDLRGCNFEEASVYSVFSCAFLFLLRLWKFHRPPIENALTPYGFFTSSELHLDFLLLLRNSRFALKDPSNVNRSSILQLDPSFQKPVYLDSFPKLRAWYLQNQACISSTLPSAYNRKSVLQVANNILKVICRKMSKGGILPVGSQPTSNSSMSGSPVGGQEDSCQGPPVTSWELLEAVPFVLETVLSACAHGRLTSRDLITGLRDLVDFLPATLAVIVSYFSAEITRGIWKPVMLNGTDWPSPASTLVAVESEIKEVLASIGVHITSPGPRSAMPMLPLPIAALMSLSITVKMEEFNHLEGIIGQGMEICATSSSWPSMPIIGALWSQKVRRWHDFIILACCEGPFIRDNNAVAQLIRSCFSSFLGPLVDGRSCFVANRGVTSLMGQVIHESGPRLSISPGVLYMRSCRTFPDNNFVCEEIFKVLIERARALANECGSDRPTRLRSGQMPLSSATSSVEQIASLAATMLCHAGGVRLIRLLYEHILPTLLLSAGEVKLGFAGPVCSIFEGFALAYVLLLSGASIWGVGETSPVYTSVYTSKRQRVVDRHLNFMAKVMEDNIELRCGQATWRAYVLCFVGLLVDFMPTWIPEVKLETLQKLASGLRQWQEHDLAFSLLERGGLKAITTVVESIL